jgi:hypothetical protein
MGLPLLSTFWRDRLFSASNDLTPRYVGFKCDADSAYNAGGRATGPGGGPGDAEAFRLPMSLLRPDKANPHREPHEAGEVVHAQALHELGAVRLHGPVADPEPLGDLLA